MTAPPQRRKIIAAGGLTGRQIESEVKAEVARIKDENVPVLFTGKCRVCQDPESRKRVNTLLGYGMKPAEILEQVADINEKRPKNAQITAVSLTNHRTRHFNVQEKTTAGYRRILERRKAQLSDEMADASGSLLSGMAFLDVVAQKGWQDLINEETIVGFEIGLKAMLKLEEMAAEGAIEEQIAQMRREVALLHQAVFEVVPEELRDEITERIDELSGVAARRDEDVLDVEVVADDDFFDQDDDDEEVAMPVMDVDEGDSIED